MTIRVKVDVPPNLFAREARQIPFALARGINDAIDAAQKAQRQHQADVFTIRRKSFADLSVKRTKAATKASLSAVLEIQSPGGRKGIFEKFEEGGTKTPQGKSLAVPVVGSRVKRTERSVVGKANRPRALLANQATTRRVFILDRGETRTIMEASGTGKRAKVRPLFNLIPQAKIDDRLDFVDTVTAAVNESFPAAFKRRFDEALRTAR